MVVFQATESRGVPGVGGYQLPSELLGREVAGYFISGMLAKILGKQAAGTQ